MKAEGVHYHQISTGNMKDLQVEMKEYLDNNLKVYEDIEISDKGNYMS